MAKRRYVGFYNITMTSRITCVYREQWYVIITFDLTWTQSVRPSVRPGHAIRSIHGQGNPHPKRGEVGTSRRFAVVCRWRVSAICTIRQAKTFLFIVFPWIKLQEESGYSKAVVVFLYCKRFAGKIDVDSSRNRIDASLSCRV